MNTDTYLLFLCAVSNFTTTEHVRSRLFNQTCTAIPLEAASLLGFPHTVRFCSVLDRTYKTQLSQLLRYWIFVMCGLCVVRGTHPYSLVFNQGQGGR